MSTKFKRLVSMLLAAALLIPTSWVAPAASAASDVTTVYHESFESGVGFATQAGNAHVTHVTGMTFTGNDDGGALYVSNRVNNWDSVDFKYADLGLVDGKTYTVTVSIYVDANETIPADAKAALQTVDSYRNYADTAFVAGQAVTLTKEFTVDKSSDSALRVNSNEAGKTVPYYIADIKFTTAASKPIEREVYHESFENGAGLATQAGGATLTHVTGLQYTGNDDGGALYVSNRVNNWDSVDFKYADLGLEDGKKYTVTASVYVDANETIPAGAQAALQTVDSYSNNAGTAFIAGQAVTLVKEFTVDKSVDSALRINSNEEGKTVPYYIGDIRITELVSNEPEPVRPPAQTFETITFEDGTTGGFEGRSGTETLTVTDEANHTENGSKALKVEGRTVTWHGPSLRVEKYVDKGYEYKVTAWVKLISPDSSQIQLSTQIGNGGSANYVALEAKTISTADGWVQYEGTYRYNSVGDEFLTIYVESSNNATASFYIDDISFVSTGSGPVEIDKKLIPIKDAYKDHFLIGNAISAEDLTGVRFDLLQMHHNVVTAGNAMKPDAMQPTKGNFTFTAADDMVNKVLDAGMKVHGHVLVWHQQSPTWLNTSDGSTPLSREEALENLRAHIKGVMEHFGNKVISWDVVNEAMNDNPQNPTDYKNALRKAPWYNAIGSDYVEQAFLAAREVLDAHPDWDIKLYYNDYNEDNQNKAEAIYSMVKDINDRYADAHDGKKLIDGIGMQGHYNLSTNPENVKRSLEKFISLGVEVSISELDIMAGNNSQLSDELAKEQGYLYAQLMKLFKENSKYISRVTFWGMDDRTSWRSTQNPLLFNGNLQAKPAYHAVIDPDKFLEGYVPYVPDSKQGTAAYGTPTIDGHIDSVWNNAESIDINQYQMAWQGANGTAKALWDDQNLYVLVQVSDAQLDKSSANAWEQDSVEVFLDQNNAKKTYYQEDDGQYRVNFDNETSFNPDSIAEGFVSATSVSGTNYTVEIKIPLTKITPANDKKIGFDVQINDGKDGARQSAATWNDTTGNAYQDTSVFGVLTLKGKQSSGGGGGGGGGGVIPSNNDNTDNTDDTGNTGNTGDTGYKSKFSDVPSNHYAAGAIGRLADLGIIKGVTGDTFAPKADVKRSELVLMITRALGLETIDGADTGFKDVPSSRSDAGAIAAAVQAGLVNGANGKFRPSDSMTREEAVVVLMRAFRYALETLNLDISKLPMSGAEAFKDQGSISKWASDDIETAVILGFVTGDTSGKFRPQSTISRAETAVLIDRMITALSSLKGDK
uniref:Beta-xylanase n=1 Tax=Paenibacillus curdlanolyticus TaxID=59840 RepID=B1A3N2_9BACL|nr:xylanase 10A [Paenibacillus curdlanolyticus]